MAGTHVGRSESEPFRIEPELGQVSEDKGEASPSNERWDVLQEREPRSYLPKHSGKIRPDPAVVVGAVAGAGDTPWLAGEPGRDEIHLSTPASAIEGGNVVPDRRRIHEPLFHARHQARGGIGFPLHVTDGVVAGSEGELKAQFQAANAAAEGQSTQGT
jgi:hypothetical protein